MSGSSYDRRCHSGCTAGAKPTDEHPSNSFDSGGSVSSVRALSAKVGIAPILLCGPRCAEFAWHGNLASLLSNGGAARPADNQALGESPPPAISADQGVGQRRQQQRLKTGRHAPTTMATIRPGSSFGDSAALRGGCFASVHIAVIPESVYLRQSSGRPSGASLSESAPPTPPVGGVGSRQCAVSSG